MSGVSHLYVSVQYLVQMITPRYPIYNQCSIQTVRSNHELYLVQIHLSQQLNFTLEFLMKETPL